MKVYSDKEIKRILKENGFTVVRSKGSHNVWEHNANEKASCLTCKWY